MIFTLSYQEILNLIKNNVDLPAQIKKIYLDNKTLHLAAKINKLLPVIDIGIRFSEFDNEIIKLSLTDSKVLKYILKFIYSFLNNHKYSNFITLKNGNLIQIKVNDIPEIRKHGIKISDINQKNNQLEIDIQINA